MTIDDFRIPFTKVVGTGNDFIVVDTIRHPVRSLRSRWRSVSRAVCDRHTGIGADGLLVLEPSRRANARMRVFNPDGSEADMCGNGARCVARYLEEVIRENPMRIETRAGVLAATVRGRRVAIQMTDPTDLRLGLPVAVEGRTLRVGCVDTGVPHAVIAVRQLDAVDVARTGRALRYHRAFAPRGTNVDFIQADPRRPGRIRIRTYERGVEDETLACGTGVAAAAVVHALSQAQARNGHGRRRVDVETRSRDVLRVSFVVRGAGRRVEDLVLEGPADRVCDGVFRWPMRRT
jgi:diaminopimelate epimerase